MALCVVSPTVFVSFPLCLLSSCVYTAVDWEPSPQSHSLHCSPLGALSLKGPLSRVFNKLAFTRCPKSCKLSQKPLVLEPKSKQSHTTVISRIEPLEEYHPVKVETTDPELFACIHQWDKENYVHVRSKSTTSTELAARTAPHPSMSTIPDKYWSFTKVFSEEASHRLLAHRPWDHAIDLIPGKTMKNSGIYRLTPSESAALKEYIMEHLWKGFIRPSSSSMASPFFFVDKKDGKLRPVQDYRKLNEITVKNAAPLLLIPDLVDKLQGAQYFTKLDVRWGYNYTPQALSLFPESWHSVLCLPLCLCPFLLVYCPPVYIYCSGLGTFPPVLFPPLQVSSFALLPLISVLFPPLQQSPWCSVTQGPFELRF